jgi:hypothetical protein
MKLQYRLIVFFLLLLSAAGARLPYAAHAQLIVQENIPIEKLVRNHFIGGGAQVSNLTYRGFPRAIGYFDGRKSNIGIDEGVLLTTGWVGYAVGPNTADDITFASLSGPDDDLEQLVGARTFDATVLQFDFLPYQDSVTFEYVFGSDEYTEYVGSPYNDVFAFFISGPGITGKENIALIPGTGIPVSINNVNHILNTVHYVNNYGGMTIEYDGFTKVLKAKATVTPCQTYQLKLAIADVSDPFLDSGVFLKSGSFDAGDALTVLGIRDAYEGGCQTGLIEILRGGNLDKPLTVHFSVRGSAVNGTDYTAIASPITFQPGQDTYAIPIDAISDGIPDNGEWVTIFIDDLCKTGLVRDSIRIFEAAPLGLRLLQDTLICEGQSVDLTAIITGGSGAFKHQWSDPAQSGDLSIRVSPMATTKYHFTLQDTLTGCQITDSVVVRVDILPFIDAGPDRPICPGESVQLGSPVQGAVTPYTIQWTPENGLSDPQSEITQATPARRTTYVMTLRTEAGCLVVDSVTIDVSDIAFDAGPDTLICHGDSAVIGRKATGGQFPYFYSWTPTDGLSDPTIAMPRASPETTTRYHVVMRSSDGCEIRDSVIVAVNRILLDAGPDTRVCRGSSVMIGDTAWSASPPLTYSWTPVIGLDDPFGPTPIATPAASTTYVLQVTDSRGCVAFDTVLVSVSEIEMDAGSDLAVCPGESVQLQGNVRRGQNPFLWRWSPGTSLSDSTIRNPIATPMTSTWYHLTVIDGFGCVGSDSVLVTVWPEAQVAIDVQGSSVLCQGDSVVLDAGAGFRGCQWSTGSTAQRIVVREAGTYWVSATTMDGCSAGSDTITVQVTDRPAPVINGPLTVCAGDSVRFSVAEAAGSVYIWQVFGGFILDGNDTHSIAVRWDAAGTYQIRIEQIFGSASCRGDTSMTVTVLPSPQPVIAPPGPHAFCEGGSVRLDGPAGFDWYLWSTGDTTRSITVTAAGSYRLTVRNEIGCEGTSPPVTVIVHPLPEPEIIPLTPMPVCEGDSVVLGLRESHASQLWSGGESGPTIVVRSAGTFTVRVRSAEGCEGISAPFTVQFLPLPEPLIVADGPLEFCEGDSVRLRTSEPFASYEWNSGASTQSIVVRSSGVYGVAVRNGDGCMAMAAPLSVTVHPLPPPPVITRPAILLEATPAATWQWYTEASGTLTEIPGATGRTYPGLPDVWYRVRIRDINGCTAISEPFRFDEREIVATSTVALPVLEAKPGDAVQLLLTLSEQSNLGVMGVTRFEARIRFNESMLVPVGNTPQGEILDGERVIAVSGAFDSTAQALAELAFVATLGNATETPLVIEYFSWDQPEVLVKRIDGLLRIAVCEEGGERLFDATGSIMLEPNHPNPFNAVTTLTYEIIERGRTELFVLDLLGRRVAALVDSDLEPGRYRVHFNADHLASGVYVAVLRTPTQLRVQRMKLIK